MSQHESSGECLVSWRDRVVDAADFRCVPMALSASDDWSLKDGGIHHRSGRFYSVIGVEEDSGRSYPLLDQPEIGLLGFVVTGPPDDTRWLAQMKVEPGNFGVAQLAPTVQATLSNIDRVHAGTSPPMVERFQDGGSPLADGLWSEQSSRFLGKRNRNTTVRTPEASEPTGLHHRWISAGRLRKALGTDFMVNTDARSVIAAAPWRLIRGTAPFTGALRRSYLHRDPDTNDRVIAALHRLPIPGLRRIPLEALPEADVDSDSSTPIRHPHFDVVHRSVWAKEREVPAWDQPLVNGSAGGRIGLALHPGADGILRAYLSVDRYGGLTHGAELTATAADPVGRRLALVRVSEEGGRFDHDLHEVEVVLASEKPTGEVAVTLGDLEAIVRTPGLTTNELRTAVAVLLSLEEEQE